MKTGAARNRFFFLAATGCKYVQIHYSDNVVASTYDGHCEQLKGAWQSRRNRDCFGFASQRQQSIAQFEHDLASRLHDGCSFD